MSYPQDPRQQPRPGLSQVPPSYVQQPPPGYQQPPPGYHQPPTGWAPAPQPPPRKRHRVRNTLLGLVGIIVLIIILVSVLNNGGSETGTTAGGSSLGGSAAGGSTGQQAASAARIGDKVRDGKFQFVITKISHRKSVGDTQYGLGDTAQGEYLIVSLRVTNIGSQSQTLDDSAQIVYDSHGRKFTASSAADIDLSGSNGSGNTWFNDINPGNTVHGKMAFDMPKGDPPAKIELHDSIFSNGVTVLLK